MGLPRGADGGGQIESASMKVVSDTELIEQLQREVIELRRRVHELEVAKLQVIAESIPVPIVVTRFSDTVVLEANSHVGPLFGLPTAELIGRKAQDFFHSPHEFRQLVVDVYRYGFVHNREVRAKKADGTIFWVAVSIERIMVEGVEALVSGFYDLTERRQAEEALRSYADELQVRNDELDAFAHTVAHDLKSPLSLISGYSELLFALVTGPDSDPRRTYLQMIAQTVHKIGNIVDELMLLSEVRKGSVTPAPLNMRAIVEEARARLSYLIEMHRAAVVISADWPTALGHAPWIEEVWINYISNGIKYGGTPKAALRLELSGFLQADGFARFQVRDYGRGLTPEEQAQLFTPFTQLAQVRATGHGLGLSIVRRIVEKLGGQVGVESTRGQGSTFYFTLPAATAPN